MRWRRLCSWAISVTAGPAILSGCAPHPVTFDATTATGSITGQPGKRGLVVAAPHAISAPRTGDIAAELARRTGFGVVIAAGDEAYERRVREVAQGPLRLLAEIHGNNHRDAAGRIEIATIGVDRELAFRLRTLLELIRDAHLLGTREAPRLEVAIEPADTLRYTASGAKRCGILRVPERALHIELPKAARAEWRELYTAILADFLVQAAAYDPGR